MNHRIIGIVAVVLLLAGSPARAGVFDWATTADGVWSDNASWSGAAAPVSDQDNVIQFFNAVGSATYTADNDLGTVQLNQLAGGNGASVTGGNLEFIQSTSSAAPILTHSGTTTFAIGSAVTLDNNLTIQGTGSIKVTGPIGGSAGITKTSAGQLTLNGNNTYAGATTVNAGTLNGAGTIAGNVTVNSGARIDSTLTINGDVAVNSGAQLKGDGTITGTTTANNGAIVVGPGHIGNLVINNGAVFSPGNTRGTMFANDTTWNGGGIYTWDINDFTGTAGADPGWDLLNIAGSLDINASSLNQFRIRITGAPVHGPGSYYGLVIASTALGINGFAASSFLLDTSSFVGPPGNGIWTIGLANNGNDLVLNFLIPEPSTSVMFGLGLVLFLIRWAICRNDQVAEVA